MLDYTAAAAEAAKKAGEMIRQRAGEKIVIENKAEYDFVTNVDKESECIIKTTLMERFPEYAFFGEEAVSLHPETEQSKLKELTNRGRTWIVDALDGTTNFIHKIPQSVVSIALAEGEQIISGVIYDPWHDNVYHAELGGGAYKNGERISVSDTAQFNRFIFSSSFPAVDMRARSQVTSSIDAANPNFTSLRIYNCAALCLAYTASGKLDAHFELGIHIWDMAAGALLVKEAGGSVTDGHGEPFSIFALDILASNGRCHGELKKTLCR